MKPRLFIVLILLCLMTVFPVHAQTLYEESDCPFGEFEGHTIDCGYLTVPEDRSDPNSPDIRLAVAIIRADNPQPDPIIYLEGGPGGSALYGVDAWLEEPLDLTRDFILIDQRGTGYSEPRLACPMDEEAELDIKAAARQCRDLLESEGVNVAAYTSAANAADIAALIDALGYDQVNLYGVSYGTRLALTVMRDHPQHIRSVILDSTYPPQVAGYEEQPTNAYLAFTQMFRDCAADAACNAAFPDLENVLYAVVEAGNAQPFAVDEGEMTGDDFLNMLFELLYDTAALPYLPAAIDAASDGDFTLLLDLQSGYYPDEENAAGSLETYIPDVPDDEDGFIELSDELLADYLGYNDIDVLYADLEDMDYDAYYATFDAFIEDMTDEDFIDLMMLFTGYETDEEIYDYFDELTDAQYDQLFENFMIYLYGEGEDVSDSDGMFNSVECYEEIPANSLTRTEELAAPLPDVFEAVMVTGVIDQFETCAGWGVPAADAFESLPVVSDIPALVVAGNYDPITPPSWGQVAAQPLTSAFFFTFPGVGHGVMGGGECPINIMTAFLNAPTTEPDSSCIASMGAPDFYTGE